MKAAPKRLLLVSYLKEKNHAVVRRTGAVHSLLTIVNKVTKLDENI